MRSKTPTHHPLADRRPRAVDTDRPRPSGFDDADALVPKHEGHWCRQVPLLDVKVGAAHSALLNSHDDIAVTIRLDHHVTHLERATEATEYGGLGRERGHAPHGSTEGGIAQCEDLSALISGRDNLSSAWSSASCATWTPSPAAARSPRPRWTSTSHNRRSPSRSIDPDGPESTPLDFAWRTTPRLIPPPPAPDWRAVPKRGLDWARPRPRAQHPVLCADRRTSACPGRPPRVHHGSTSLNTRGCTRRTRTPAKRVFCRRFSTARARPCPRFTRRCTTHNREVGGSNPPGAMPFVRRNAVSVARSQVPAAIHSVVRSSIARFPRRRGRS
jgi:hypothetical protein